MIQETEEKTEGQIVSYMRLVPATGAEEDAMPGPQ